MEQKIGEGVGVRALALIIDSVILGVGYYIFISISSMLLGERVAQLWQWILVLVYILCGIIYFVWFEWKLGATVGKQVMGLKIVSADGSQPTLKAICIRTLMRIVDGQFLYVVAAIAVAASKSHQRLGDMLAKTLVIKR